MKYCLFLAVPASAPVFALGLAGHAFGFVERFEVASGASAARIFAPCGDTVHPHRYICDYGDPDQIYYYFLYHIIYMNSEPALYTMNETTQATAVLYTNENSPHFQLPVSREIATTAAMHGK